MSTDAPTQTDPDTGEDLHDVRLHVNGIVHQVRIPGRRLLSDALRHDLGLTGTHVGCEHGVCGACTVLLEGQPVRACLMFAVSAAGQELTTVEGLAEPDGRLGPVQQAFKECHGLQCGFCTPGFLTTITAGLRDNPDPTEDEAREMIGGNLCRCTGYRPIRDAALSMGERADTRPPWADDPELEREIRNLAPLVGSKNQNSESQERYLTPSTLADLIDTMQRHPDARLVAGATDLWLEVTQRLEHFETLIDLRQVRELRQIEETADGWWIGAAVTYREWEPLLAEHYPAFAHLLTRLGSAQIRNRGTVGGNIANASPIGDTPPVLLTLDARLRLAGPEGVRELPLSSFFLDYKKTALEPGECVAAIYLPKPQADLEQRVWKLSKRREDDISTLLGAFRWRREDGVLTDVRVAYGGMAAIPLRVTAVEAALEGRKPDAETFDAAKQALRESLAPMSDARGSRDYRLTAATNLLERWRLTLANTDSTTPTQEVTLDAYAH